MKHILITIALIGVASSTASAQTPAAREFQQLTEQHRKALAVAVEPVNRRQQTALEALQRRATQAGDLETALKIKESLKELSPNITADGAAATAGQMPSRREVEKAIVGGWTWGAPNKWITLSAEGTAVLDDIRMSWKADLDRVVTLTDKRDPKRKAKMIFAPDLSSYTGTDFSGKPIEGTRHQKQ